MKLTIRLYKRFDLDLIYLAHYEDFSLCRTIKECVKAYARGEVYKISMPQGRLLSGVESKPTYTYVIHLDETKDSAAVQLMKSVKSLQKNAFLKTLLRSFMIAPCPEAFLTNKALGADSTAAFERLIRVNDTRKPISKPKTEGRQSSEEAGISEINSKKSDRDTPSAKKPKKKSAIEAFGNIVLKQRDETPFVTQPKAQEEMPLPELPPKVSRESILFPSGQSTTNSHGTDAVIQAAAGIKDTDSSFNVFDALSGMVTEY